MRVSSTASIRLPRRSTTPMPGGTRWPTPRRRHADATPTPRHAEIVARDSVEEDPLRASFLATPAQEPDRAPAEVREQQGRVTSDERGHSTLQQKTRGWIPNPFEKGQKFVAEKADKAKKWAAEKAVKAKKAFTKVVKAVKKVGSAIVNAVKGVIGGLLTLIQAVKLLGSSFARALKYVVQLKFLEAGVQLMFLRGRS